MNIVATGQAHGFEAIACDCIQANGEISQRTIVHSWLQGQRKLARGESPSKRLPYTSVASSTTKAQPRLSATAVVVPAVANAPRREVRWAPSRFSEVARGHRYPALLNYLLPSAQTRTLKSCPSPINCSRRG